MAITLTLRLDVPVRPMDAKGLKQKNHCGFLFKFLESSSLEKRKRKSMSSDDERKKTKQKKTATI